MVAKMILALMAFNAWMFPRLVRGFHVGSVRTVSVETASHAKTLTTVSAIRAVSVPTA